MSLTHEIADYLNELETVRRASPLTVKNYRSTLEAFARGHRVLNDANVKAFLRGFSHAPTANTVLIRLKGFAGFLDTSLKIARAKEVVKDPEALSSTEVDKLLLACAQIDSELRDQVFVLVRTGLRIHEFLALDDSSISERDGITSLRVLGKGQKVRDVPLSSDTVEAYRRLQLPIRLSVKSFRTRLARASTLADMPFTVNPHKLRSSCASILMNERGADSALVAKILGWSGVEMLVQRYYKPSLKKLHSVL